VISSLAGRTGTPRQPEGEVRTGGFGGTAGLAAYLHDHAIAAVVDATHPFAARMGWNAAHACAATAVPLLRLHRPVWVRQNGDLWDEAASREEAAAIVARQARRVLLALGRQDLAPFTSLDHVWFLIRAIEPPEPMPRFSAAEFLPAKGPFPLEAERALLRDRRIDTIVCKNSGGDAASAKLTAAREHGVRVVIIRRPARPSLPEVATVAAAADWVSAIANTGGRVLGVESIIAQIPLP